MVIASQSVISAAVLGMALAAVTLFSHAYGERCKPILKTLFALGAGFIISTLVLFLLPVMFKASESAMYFTIIGILLVPVLHLALSEKEKETKKNKHPLQGVLSWARVGVFAIIYGDAMALLSVNPLNLVLFSLVSFFALAPDFLHVYALLRFEGARSTRAAWLTSALALLPLVAVVAVGTLVLAVLPELTAPFVGLAGGTMLYIAIADQVQVSLRKRSWSEMALALIGAAAAALIMVFL